MNSRHHSIHAVPHLPAATIAVFAGLLGTITQIIWLRILIQWYGASATTVAATLAVSLAGLSLGAFLFRDAGSRLFGRDSSPLRSAGWLMILASVAVLAGLCGYALADSNPINLSRLVGQPLDLLVTAISFMMPLNLAIGGILPTLVSSDRHDSPARLYAAETLGGAVGALATGLWLTYALGLTASLLAISVLGSLVGSVALWSSARLRSSVTRAMPPTIANDAIVTQTSRWLLAAIFLAGVASIGMEVVWQRLLILVVGTDNYSYTIVVTSYLLGICLGALAHGWLTRRGKATGMTAASNQPATFAWLQLGVALTSIGVLTIFCQLASGIGQQWLVSFQAIESPLAKRFVLCFGLLLLPTALVGASFPAAVAGLAGLAGLTGHDQQTTRATARVYAIGSIGNVVGVLLCGFVLVPAVGLQHSAVVLSGIAVVAGFVWLIACQSPASRSVGWLLAATCGVLGTAIVFRPQPVGLAEQTNMHRLIFYREGPANTVGVIEESVSGSAGSTANPDSQPQPAFRSLSVDGIVIGESDGGVDEKQRLLAHLPLIVDAASPPSDGAGRLNILTIGLGTGILAGEAAAQPAVKQLTCVELSPAVITAAKLFHASNRDVFNNSKAKIVQSDGIHYLRQSSQTFDAIISDGKSRPGHAGNIAFFTTEYYRIAHARLSATGTFVQWLPLAAPLDETRVILKTFAQQFPHAYIAIAAPDSIYLVGRRQPLAWSAAHVRTHLDQALALHRYGWTTLDDLRSMAWLDAKQVAAEFLIDAPTNTFDRPVLERFAVASLRPADQQHTLDNLGFLREAIQSVQIPLALDHDLDVDNADDETNMRAACVTLIDAALAEVTAAPGWIDTAAENYQQVLRTLPKLTRGIRLSDKLLAMIPDGQSSSVAEQNSMLLSRAARFSPNDVTIQAAIGQALMAAGAYDQAASCLYRASKIAPHVARHHIAFARCMIQLGKPSAAVRPLQTALRLESASIDGHQLMAVAAQLMGDSATATKHKLISQQLQAAQ